jgi:hypothetical protein
MTRQTAWVAVVVLGAVAGCSNNPPPIRVAPEYKPDPAEQPVALPREPAPATSDPAAQAVVADALNAHTNGQPKRIEDLRSTVQTRTGRLTGLTGEVKAEWELQWVWPDRLRLKWETPGQPTIVLVRSGGSAAQELPAPKRPITDKPLRGVLADCFGETMTALVPLADPSAVFTQAPDAEVNKRPAVGVRVAGKDFPPAVVHFDKQTKLLAQYAYEGVENEVVVTKEVVVLGVKEFNGVKLPEKVQIKWNGRPNVEWTITKVEFPAKIDPKLFEGP